MFLNYVLKNNLIHEMSLDIIRRYDSVSSIKYIIETVPCIFMFTYLSIIMISMYKKFKSLILELISITYLLIILNIKKIFRIMSLNEHTIKLI